MRRWPDRRPYRARIRQQSVWYGSQVLTMMSNAGSGVPTWRSPRNASHSAPTSASPALMSGERCRAASVRAASRLGGSPRMKKSRAPRHARARSASNRATRVAVAQTSPESVTARDHMFGLDRTAPINLARLADTVRARRSCERRRARYSRCCSYSSRKGVVAKSRIVGDEVARTCRGWCRGPIPPSRRPAAFARCRPGR